MKCWNLSEGVFSSVGQSYPQPTKDKYPPPQKKYSWTLQYDRWSWVWTRLKSQLLISLVGVLAKICKWKYNLTILDDCPTEVKKPSGGFHCFVLFLIYHLPCSYLVVYSVNSSLVYVELNGFRMD